MAIANLLNQISYSFNMIRDVSEKKNQKGGEGGHRPPPWIRYCVSCKRDASCLWSTPHLLTQITLI